MTYPRLVVETCSEAKGTVVVIDVLRAFSTAAFAFAAGAEKIILVSKVEEALSLKKQIPKSKVMGEVEGMPVPEFDYSNSPQEFIGANLNGITLIQRTTAGTQGVVNSRSAENLFAASFVCAGATARALSRKKSAAISFVITGQRKEADGEEDMACADFIEALLGGDRPEKKIYLERVVNSWWGQRFGDPSYPYLPRADLDLCVMIDRFDFAMKVEREDGSLVLRAENDSKKV